MQRYNFYDQQKVSEGELDGAFDAVETAVDRIYGDLDRIGIAYGANVTEHAPNNFTVDLTQGIVIDQTGQRAAWSGTLNIDMTQDENGVPTSIVGVGQDKYLSVFAEFKRTLSDPRVDGNQATVFFNRAENYQINVVQGAEAPTGTAVPPGLRSSQILLADVLFNDTSTVITNAMIDTSRTEWGLVASGTNLTIARARLNDALQDIVDAIDTVAGSGSAALAAHIAETTLTPEHFATALEFTGPSPTFHDGSYLITSSLETVVDNIITFLADDGTYGAGGGDKVGIEGQTVGIFSTSSGSIYDQMGDILTLLGTVNSVSISATWANADTIAATTIEAAISEIVNDLADDLGTSGAHRVGCQEVYYVDTSHVILPGTPTVWDQLSELLKKQDIENRLRAASRVVKIEEIDTGFFPAGDGFEKVIWDGKDSLNNHYIAVGFNAASPVDSAFIATNNKFNSTLWAKEAKSGGTPDYFYDVIYAPGVTSHPYVAVGQEDATPTDCAIYTTTDSNGITWAKQTTSSLNIKTIRSICHDADSSGRLIVVGYDASGNAAIAYSLNGSTWYNATTIPAGFGELYAVAADASGNIVAVGADTGTGSKFLLSTDGGSTWVAAGGTGGDVVRSVTWDPISDNFYACGGSNIWISSNHGVSFATFNGADDDRSSFYAVATDGLGMVVFKGLDFVYILAHAPDGTSGTYVFQSTNLWTSYNGGSFIPQTGEWVWPGYVFSSTRPAVEVASLGAPMFTY